MFTFRNIWLKRKIGLEVQHLASKIEKEGQGGYEEICTIKL